MKHIVIAMVIAFLAATASGGEVGVSLTVVQPGFYGRIDIGELPHPELIFPQPMIIQPVVGVVHAPVYLHVPPGHARDWAKHCHQYNACGERVFFVQDRWYNEIYIPHHEKHHGKPEDNPGHGHAHGHGDEHRDHHED